MDHEQRAKEDSHVSPLWGSPAQPAQAPSAPATDAKSAAGQAGLGATAAGAAPLVGHWADAQMAMTAAPAPAARASGSQSKPASPAPEQESVVYLGINDASRQAEKAAFAGQKNATLLMGSDDYKKAGKVTYTDRPVDENGNPKLDQNGNPIEIQREVDVSKMKKDEYLKFMQGKTMSADGKSLLDLNNEKDVDKFLEESGIGGQLKGETDGAAGKARLEAVKKMFSEGGFQPGVRDEMAQFVQVLKKVQNGEMKMDRLVMSGHSTGEWVYSEAEGNPGVTFEQMKQLMDIFPSAQKGVEDLMLSACHTLEKEDPKTGYGNTETGAQYKDMFTNLQTVWGYNKQSPSYQTGSIDEIKTWLKASQGHDKGAVTKAAYGRRQFNATALEGEDIGTKAARQRGEKREF
jgi:hypothetical protein